MHAPQERSGRPTPARDLEPREREVATWFAALDRAPAPDGLRLRLRAATGRGAVATRSWVGRFPLGGWGLASAAVLLLAFGVAATVELAVPTPQADRPASHLPGDSLARLVIVEDPTMALFHDVETFDEVGLAPGELIADWGR